VTDNHILLISLSNIGDAVMTTPVLQALHAKFPDAIIDIVADKRSSEIFLNCPYRGEIIYKNKKSFLRGGPALIGKLRSHKYDLVVDLRTDGLAWLLRADKKLTRWQSKPYGPHSVEQHMGIIHKLHGKKEIPPCCVWISKTEENYAKEVLGNYYGRNLLGLGPGANWPGKIWPCRSYLGLIERLKDCFDAVVLLGDSKDHEVSTIIAAQSRLPCIDLCGKTSLLQAAAVLKQIRFFAGNDSGLGHLASGVNTPTITIFGIGDPVRYHPWGNKARWLVGDGMNIENITVEYVAAFIEDYLAENGPD
jgi:ADP-heptose:LPS heptosyltransferase